MRDRIKVISVNLEVHNHNSYNETTQIAANVVDNTVVVSGFSLDLTNFLGAAKEINRIVNPPFRPRPKAD